MNGLRGMAMVVAWAALLLLLSACAGGRAPVAQAVPGDITTASDQTDARRRASIRLELASGYFEQGQTTVALDEIKQALLTDPGFADAYNLRGLVYMRLNDMALAEDSFQRAFALSPRDPNVAHNYGWLLCQQARYAQAEPLFAQALSSPQYADKAKTWMAQGLCQMRGGQSAEAERSLARASELDPGNPIPSYNLARLLYARGDYARAQFYIRRLNSSELANAETLWLGVRIERRLGSPNAARLAEQLRRRFPEARETQALERGAFDD
ncbi:MAG TPA: type IV pilus biogenesis/stability protein PilW [Burkholderiaceae bacterium]